MLARKTPPFQRSSEEVSAALVSFPLADHIRALMDHSDVAGTSFQSVAVRVLQTLKRVHTCEQRVAEAAISLAQREKLHTMVVEVATIIQVLHETLNPHSAAMLDRAVPASTGKKQDFSWWYALCEALHVLEEGDAGLTSLAAGQPRNDVAGTLCHSIASLLQQHYHAVFVEAEQWMS